MKVIDVLKIIDSFSPFFLQEDYDNSGLQFGDFDEEVSKMLIALDLTKAVLAEAIKNKANLIITHHPPIFTPLRHITSNENPTLLLALRNNLNVISVHTNYDLAKNGLNDYVANLLAIRKIKPIVHSKEKMYKFSVYAPVKFAEDIKDALFKAGAGAIGNYSESSFSLLGRGTFKPLEGAKPFIGQKGKKEELEEVKIETIIKERDIQKVLSAMRKAHSYEEPAFDIYEILLETNEGIGILGETDKEMQLEDFIKHIKKKLGINYVRLIKGKTNRIRKVALCTGSGGNLINEVNKQNVDLFITGDIDYHQALHSKEIGLNIVDVEHFETEKFFIKSLSERLEKAHIRKNLIITSKVEVSPFLIT